MEEYSHCRRCVSIRYLSQLTNGLCANCRENLESETSVIDYTAQHLDPLPEEVK